MATATPSKPAHGAASRSGALTSIPSRTARHDVGPRTDAGAAGSNATPQRRGATPSSAHEICGKAPADRVSAINPAIAEFDVPVPLRHRLMALPVD
jgi:hypothetical protein